MYIRHLILLMTFVLMIIPSQTLPQTYKYQDNTIPILAFHGIPENITTTEWYNQMKEAGITVVFTGFSTVSNALKALDVAESSGIKILLYCPELITNTTQTVKKVMNHPALAGYFISDEPSADKFTELGILVNKIKKIDPDHFCYINLFPNYATNSQLKTKTYNNYVSSFFNRVPLEIYSFDYYPILKDSIRGRWYENLELFHKITKSYNKTFWAFVLSTAHGVYPIPNIAHLRLQVYSNLTYGAQGIQYFTFWTPSSTSVDFNNGPIFNGIKTPVFELIKQINGEIQKKSFVFLHSEVQSVFHMGNNIPTGTKKYNSNFSSIIDLSTSKENEFIISQINNKLKKYIVILNKSLIANSNIKITARRKLFIRNNDLDSKFDTNDILTKTILPGDILIIEYE